MPAVPAFAGDLQSKGALGTRAIMEFQYFSISRGGHSILEKLRAAGIEDTKKYIGFYNLRSFDRINTSSTMGTAEQRAGVSYENARQAHDQYVGGGDEDGSRDEGSFGDYQKYQRGAAGVPDTTLDTISSCYMNGGPALPDLSWKGDPEDEINAFVSEELYVHSKLLIADDRLVICGSANLNDRSQLGTHDSEIAVVVEDPTPVDALMDGEPYTASLFAASLRRHIFRKHLGLLPDQPWDRPDQNWQPADCSPNAYDWGSPADLLVRDPVHPNFDRLWTATAECNTEVFSRAFHPVPNDKVRTWDDYKEFFARHFTIPGGEEKKEGKGEENQDQEAQEGAEAAKVEYGHIVREEFPGGIQEVKEWLGQIRGTLVDMPLDFLVDVDDIAKEGLTLNGFTDELYT
jgi:phospholipase D1/2